MSNPVIQHPVVLKRSMNHITEAAYLLAQSVCEYTHAQCAIINAGLLVKDIVKDEVTEYDIHQMLPHPINMVRVRLSGVKLKEIIAKSNKQEYMYEHAQGLGFRGIYLEDIFFII